LASESEAVVLITVGVDTHVDVHVAVALDQLGRRLGSLSFPTTPTGYGELVAWVGRLGTLEWVGVEGAGSFGAGLTRWLRARGVAVLEVARPNRQLRRHAGKSDRIDAEAAARAVQAGAALGRPQEHRRAGRDAAGLAGGPTLSGQGPDPGRQPAARLGHNRPGPAAR
jgi:transposase